MHFIFRLGTQDWLPAYTRMVEATQGAILESPSLELTKSNLTNSHAPKLA